MKRLSCAVIVFALAAPAYAADPPPRPEEEEILDVPEGDDDDDDAPAKEPAPAPPTKPEPPPRPEPPAQPEPPAKPEPVPPKDDEDVEDDSGEGTEKDPYTLRGVKIRYTEEDIFRTGGSATSLDSESLDRQEYDDAHSVLSRVTGVYLRTEDGYGLRPNIGLRGASAERSKKVTLMEDGILFGPAPYSAPAAYYFPLMTRITGVEVFKGPAAIMYGPNTIGGAINLLSRPIPRELTLALDAAIGTDLYVKGHGLVGMSADWGGFLIEGAHIRTNGFKELDGGGDTGFAKSEVTVKAQLNSDPAKDVFHRVEIKGTYSSEGSDETYLGLSDADFASNALRRYLASGLDRMEWDRWSAALRYDLLVGDTLDVITQLYLHTFSRSWFKVNRFVGKDIASVLQNPTSAANSLYYGVLTGAQDSSGNTNLIVGDNARDFLVLGAQTAARLRLKTGDFAHEVELGLRYHYDEIERNHTEDEYEMASAKLTRTPKAQTTTTKNVGSTGAFAAYLRYGLTWKGLTITPGLRAEIYETKLEDTLTGAISRANDTAFLGGVGLTYEIIEGLNALAGVHQGFSPVAPGQASGVSAEESVNYEVGIRYSAPDTATLAEAIFFFNDYSNIVGQCSFSSGCGDSALDDQFNGGEARVLGVEVVAGHRFEVGAVHIPIRLAYTFTDTRFATSFKSSNPQFGDVEEGDELPYVPTHQLSAEVGVGMSRWDFTLVGTFVDAMREEAGQGDTKPGETTDAVFYLDAMFRVQIIKQLQAYARVENILLQEAVASRRPFGARPGKPFIAQLGLKFAL